MRTWTKDEIRLLKQKYPKATWSVLLERLPKKTKRAIRNKANRLRLVRKIPFWVHPTRQLHLTGVQKGLLVGLIEGEGTIGLTKRSKPNPHFRPFVQIVNTDLQLLKTAKDILKGIGKIYSHGPVPQNHKQSYVYRVSSMTDILSVLNELETHLLRKRRNAELIREFIGILMRKSPPELLGGRGGKKPLELLPREKEIVEELHQLNKRGK